MLHATVFHSRLRRCTSALAWLAAIAALAGCSEKSPASAGAGKGGRNGGAAPVLVGKAQRKVVPLVLDAIGAVEPIRTATVRAQVTGTLMKIDIKEGHDVQAGDLVFEIDPRPFQIALESANADHERIRGQLDYARAQVTRYQTLSADAMVSKEQYQKIQDDERTLAAQLAAADAAVANARLQLDYCSIRAPIGGRTGNLNVHEGDLIRANDVGAMLTINQLSPIYVTFGIPQQYLGELNRYRAANTLQVAVLPPGEDQPETGELTFVDNTVDPTTGTLKLKGTFPNLSQRLWPGEFATTTVTLANPEALTIPTSAIQNAQNGQHVFVVHADKTAELRPVVVERSFEDDAVIAKGLQAGEVVVTDGQLRVIDGKPVEIKQPDAGSSADGTGKPKGKAKPKKTPNGEVTDSAITPKG